MLIIRNEQKDRLHQALQLKFRESVVEDFKKKGFEAEDDLKTRTILLRDKAGGESSIKSHYPGISLISGENRTHRFEYDSENQMTSVTDPNGLRIVFERDEEKRLTEIKRGSDNSFRFEYDGFSNLAEMRFPDGAAQQFSYDKNGDIIKVVNRNGHEKYYDYSEDGLLIGQIDEKGNETRFEYSGLDAPSAIEFPNGDRFGFEYDDNGTLNEFYVNDESHAAFRIDPGSGTMEVDYADGEKLRFSAKGSNITEAVNNNGTVKFTYDSQGRVVTEETDGKIVTYLRNEIGALIGMVTPDKEVFLYERDSENRVTKINEWSGRGLDIQYDLSGALERIGYPNGTVVHRRSNPMGGVGAMSIETGKARVYQCDYEYDACDRMVKAEVSGEDLKKRSDAFVYDDEGRLLRVESSDPGHSEFFRLDANGNRIRDALGIGFYNEADQLVKHAGMEYRYDGLGAMISGRCPVGEAAFTYNGRSQLVEVVTERGKTRYVYDAFGRRIAKDNNGLITRYTWAGHQLISEITQLGKTQFRTDYMYFPEKPVPMAMRVDGEIYYIQSGLRAEPLCVTDQSGKVVWKAEYDAFGQAKILVETIKQPFRLAGQYFDEETGLHYNLARYYNPQLGRFLTRDPLFDEGGSTNYYIYCNGDPVNRLDPEGEFLFCACLIGAAIGAAIGAGVEYFRQKKAIKEKKQKGYSAWGFVKAAAIGGVIGAIGGGVGAAVEGAFAAGVTATVAGGAGVGALSGTVSSVAEQCAEAALTGKSLSAWEMTKQTLVDGLVGGVIGAVTAGIGGILARRAKKAGSEAIEQATKKAKPKIRPKGKPKARPKPKPKVRPRTKLPSPTSKTDEATEALLKAIDDSDIPNKLKKKCQAVGALENPDGSVTVALSGGKETVEKMKTKLEPLLPKNPDGTPKYKFASSEADTSHFSSAKKVRKDGTEVTIPGSENNCVEPKLLNGVKPEDAKGMTVKWRGKGDNPYPSARGRNDMAPCDLCKKNVHKMYKE